MPTITRSNREFPGGAVIGASSSSITGVTAGSPQDFSTDMDYFLPDPAHPDTPFHYRFLFWNVCGTIGSNAAHGTGTMPAGNTVATAWYVRVGGGNGEGITTWAFWVEHDSVVSDTPIASVNPAAAWAGGNATTVSVSAGSGPRIITARNTVPSITNASFLNWFPFGAGTPAATTLTVDHGVSTSALALYKHQDLGSPRKPGGNDPTTKPGPISRFDPSPMDRTRLLEMLAAVKKETHPVSDRFTATLKNEKANVSADDLRGLQVELKANLNRMQSAIEFINAKLEGK